MEHSYEELKHRHRKAVFLMLSRNMSITLICDSLSLPEAVVLELQNEYIAGKLKAEDELSDPHVDLSVAKWKKLLEADNVVENIKNIRLMPDEAIHQLAERGIKAIENLLAKEEDR